MRNLHQLFDWQYIGQIIGRDFAKFCGLIRMYELLKIIFFIFKIHNECGYFWWDVLFSFHYSASDIYGAKLKLLIWKLMPPYHGPWRNLVWQNFNLFQSLGLRKFECWISLESKRKKKTSTFNQNLKIESCLFTCFKCKSLMTNIILLF